MKIAIMQPYIFPYIGYFQLLNAADKFVNYDDVNFINKGWINRNRILVSNKANLFTIPLEKSSQNKLIKDIQISESRDWKSKFLKTVELSYRKAPYFDDAFGIISRAIQNNDSNISRFISKSLVLLCNHLEIETNIIESSSVYNNSTLKNQNKIIDICHKENSDNYINPVGGKEIYSEKKFADEGIKINFLRSKPIQYNQYNDNFIDSLSIIDVLMFNSKDKIKEFLNEYDLL
ncbi:MAG: WbqC family protein [bacterium]